MASVLTSLGVFASVVALAGAMTVTGLSFTADTVAKVAAATPVKTQKLKPSYIAYMPPVKAEALNIAKSVPVTQVVPKASDPLAASPAPVPVPVPSFTHTVAVDSLRVRNGPRKTTLQIFALKGGAPVNVIKEDGGWVLITAGGDRVGWVYAKMLRPAG